MTPRQPPGDAPPSFSVIICAYTMDRWDDLQAAVESVRAQTVPPTDIIVVIDANDELERLARRELPGVVVKANRYGGGLSGGRRTGAEHATAPFLAFLDDDAIADPVWLEQLGLAYDDPNVLGAGGLVDPLWADERPAWLPPEFDWTVGCTYAGLPVDGGKIRSPIGANMSMRASVLDAVGSFEPRLGRSDRGKSVSGTAEETEFCIRATQQHPGGYWAYRPLARVRHVVPPSRATWRYFIGRCRLEGQAKAILSDIAGSTNALRSERLYVRSVLPRAFVRELVAAPAGRGAGILRAGTIAVGLSVTAATYLWRRACMLTGLG
jgi:glucosyl-dolichyl phosphate glucuronosyltransferase